MTDKECVEQFVRDMKSVVYWSKQIRALNLELEAIGNKLQGLSSPTVKEVVYENVCDPYSNNKIELMYIEEGIQNDIQKLVDRIDEVETIFMYIENEDDFNIKQCMLDLYLLNMKQEDAVIKYSMARRTIFRRINKAIGRAMLTHWAHKTVV